jgi:3-dehydroquinate dehydratase/shikimate dehydrogenase
MPCHLDHILPASCVMDINTLPLQSVFLERAKNKGCKTIYGWQMFVEQASLQFALWFPSWQFAGK